MAQAVEGVLVQEFIAHATVEDFNVAVLHRFTRRAVVPLDFPVLLPLEDRVAGQLCPVVRGHHAGVAPNLGDPILFPADTNARQRCVDDGRQAFSAEVVDHVQYPEPMT